MGVAGFDTLKFVRRLEKAGVSTEQAEVQAEVLTEVFTVNLESFVTKEYLAARLAELKADIDVKLRVLTIMVGIIMAAVIIPYLERLAAL